jgi:acyl carrier protein
MNSLINVNDKIVEIIKESIVQKNIRFGEPEIEYEITPQTALYEISVDSITFIQIIVSIEEAFSIEFDDEMLLYESFADVQSIVDYTNMKLSM